MTGEEMAETEIRKRKEILAELYESDPEFSTAEKNYLRKLIIRDKPTMPETYRGYNQGEVKTYMCCAVCRKNLRTPTEKRKPEDNQFCPACGQRIKWPRRVLEAGRAGAQETAGDALQPAT